MSYRIKSVAALTGINTATLRAWERRYGLVAPQRTPGGYRVYSDQDVDTISRIKTLLDRGLKVGEAVTIVRRGEETPALPEAAVSTDALRAAILQALLDFDRAAADRLYERVATIPFPERVDGVLMPLLREIGELWACGEAAVTQEHFATVFAREKLDWMLGFLAAAPAVGPEAVFAGLPGEQHELGLMGAAVHLAARGWRVTYLGANVPFRDLEATLAARPLVLLCTSVIQPVSRGELLETARRLRKLAPARAGVVLGGGGIPADAPEVPTRGVAVVRRMEDVHGVFAPAARA